MLFEREPFSDYYLDRKVEKGAQMWVSSITGKILV